MGKVVEVMGFEGKNNEVVVLSNGCRLGINTNGEYAYDTADREGLKELEKDETRYRRAMSICEEIKKANNITPEILYLYCNDGDVLRLFKSMFELNRINNRFNKKGGD